MILTLLIVIGGGVYVYQSKNSVQTSNIEEGKNLNKYIMDVIFDDESKRLMCNQNVEYVNNTNIALDKIYFHIYPNAFPKKEFAPFEKDEMNQAYPNGFNEGYIDIKNVFWLQFAGIICFSFSLYLLSISPISFFHNFLWLLGPITPIGGLLMIISWVILALKF